MVVSINVQVNFDQSKHLVIFDPNHLKQLQIVLPNQLRPTIANSQYIII